jgi:transcriptional regulator with PAS, ATPase and Fis domain
MEAARPREDARPADVETMDLLGASDAIRRVRDLIVRVAPTDATVLVTGESGTGKELVARSLHRLSRRRHGPFVPVNCGAIPATLIEAELFGYEKGSFTGAQRGHRGYVERANGGTLFLDEITEMPIQMQTPLLRFMEVRRYMRIGGTQEMHTDVRIVAATNRDPVAAVADRHLREDLYYRLAVFPIEVPPLRSREGDALLIAQAFLRQLNLAGGTSKALSAASLEAIRRHRWPGNVRELRHSVERAYILAADELEIGEALGLTAGHGGVALGEDHAPAVRISIGSTLEEVEREIIEATLEYFAGNKRHAASALGCSLKTLYNKLNAYARTAGHA